MPLNTTMTENFFIYNRTKYRRRNAHELGIFRAGYKRDPATAAAWLEYQTEPGPSFSTRSLGTPITVSASFLNDTDISAGIEYDGMGAKATSDKLLAGTLKLVMFQAQPVTLAKDINKCGFRKRLVDIIDPLKKERIITTAFYVVEAELYSQWNIRADVEYRDAALQFEAAISSNRTSSWQPSRGSCFAYSLSSINWKGSGDNREVDELNFDKVGL